MANNPTQPEVPTVGTPWYAAYPSPKTTDLLSFSKEDILEMLNESKESGKKDYILIDVRRTDYEGGSIRGSINLPAQSLFSTIPTLYTLFKAAGLKKVIWFCGSSRGRGTRAAGWFADHIERTGDDEMNSYILEGGIKGWAVSGNEYVDWMDEYVESAWVAK